jgi:hypothetical protein
MHQRALWLYSCYKKDGVSNMATTDDFTFGHDRDEVLQELESILPSYADDPIGELAGIIWLDEKYGLRKEDDYYLITPGYAGWVVGTLTVVDNPRITELMGDESESDELAAELDALVTSAPFKLKFEVNPTLEVGETDEAEQARWNFVWGKTVLVRVMNETETGRLPAMLSVRADGAFIQLPNSPASVAEANA